MTTQAFMIGPIKDGLRKDIKPFATPEDSFTTLTNAYQWRGRIVKRSGYTLLGRLRRIDVSVAGLSLTLNLGQSVNLISALGLGATAQIEPGSINIIGVLDGTTYTDPLGNGTLVATGGTGVGGTINYTTGVLTIIAGGGQSITGTFSYFPGLPVMGLRTREGFNIDVQDLIAFDTRKSYLWNGTGFQELPSVMPVTWSGTDYQFFWTINYANAFWATNFVPGLHGWVIQNFTNSAGVGAAATVDVTANGNTAAVNDFVYFLNVTGPPSANNLIYAQVISIVTTGVTFKVQVQRPPSTTFTFTNGVPTSGMVLDSMQTVAGQDGIRYYGDLTNGLGWANYNPPIDPNNALAGALLIFAYRGYLVFLNTWEGHEGAGNVVNYPNRARWTQIGTPFYSEPVPAAPNLQTFDVKTARDDLFGRGGAYDAPTNEVIVAAGFIRDILVVYFERSTWRLRFVNNSQNPFVWERVNVELGSDCTFSALPFDKGLMAIGDRGIVISDGNDSSRFDEKIPDEFFNIRQTEHGFNRVYGIRTFRTKLNYWTFPSSDHPDGIYPDKVLVFNYETRNWSFFDDCFTCFGYYYPSGTGYTWGDLPDAWSSYTNISWNSGVSEAQYENVISGNQQGYVFVLEETNGQNDESLFISAINSGVSPAIFTSPNNNLPDGSWITLVNVSGVTSDDGVSLNGRNFKLSNSSLNANDFTLSEFKPINGGLATGGTYTYTIGYQNLIPGSIEINIGTLVFTDPNVNGVLVEASTLSTGFINYNTGLITLFFVPVIAPTQVYIRIVSLDPSQGLSVVSTTGTLVFGEIAKISGIDIQTKFFNFFKSDSSSRLSKIDFYVDSTTNGQFTCNVFGDSGNTPLNEPLSDNPMSNIVLTSTNPYQVGHGDETIYRLFADAVAQTIQLQLTFSDQQMATNIINRSDIQILALIFTLRGGGRII